MEPDLFIRARWMGGEHTPTRIVVHGTVSPCAPGGARAVANFFATTAPETSAHYIVDPQQIAQCVPDDRISWSDGTNTGSLSVELCDPQTGPGDRWDNQNHRDMLALAARLVRDRCQVHGIPVRLLTPHQVRQGLRGICGHDTMRQAFPGSTTHTDPGEDFPWAEFIEQVNRGGGDDVSAEDVFAHRMTFDDWDGRGKDVTATFQQSYQNMRREVRDLSAAVREVNAKLDKLVKLIASEK